MKTHFIFLHQRHFICKFYFIWPSNVNISSIQERHLITRNHPVVQCLMSIQSHLDKHRQEFNRMCSPFQRKEKLRLLELRASASAGGVGGSNVTAFRHMMMTTAAGPGVSQGSRMTRALVSAVGPRKFN